MKILRCRDAIDAAAISPLTPLHYALIYAMPLILLFRH